MPRLYIECVCVCVCVCVCSPHDGAAGCRQLFDDRKLVVPAFGSRPQPSCVTAWDVPELAAGLAVPRHADWALRAVFRCSTRGELGIVTASGVSLSFSEANGVLHCPAPPRAMGACVHRSLSVHQWLTSSHSRHSRGVHTNTALPPSQTPQAGSPRLPSPLF